MTADDDSKPTPTPTFHPLFATKNPSDTIFESSDGVRFAYDWDLLARLSTFFKDTKSVHNLSPKATSEAEVEVIPLPATSAALAYALEAINVTLRGAPPPKLELGHFDDVLTLADSLDLPLVTRALLHTAKAAQLEPSIVITLSILAGDKSDFRNVALALLAHPVEQMSTWSLDTLKRHAPLDLIAIYELHNSWRHSVNSLARGSSNHGFFARTCKRDCKNFHEHGDLANLVNGELKTVAKQLLLDPSLIVKNFYTPDLGCVECNSRVEHRVTQALCSARRALTLVW